MKVHKVHTHTCLCMLIHTAGFEPTKHDARHLKCRPFDRSGTCAEQ